MKRLLYVCLDGLGDDPIPELGGQTPLEAAETPFLDALAQQGRTGTVITVGPGIAPESDIAVFAILGYDPREEHPGRGVVEAVGAGMDFRDGDLAYRVNFATADWPQIVDRRVGRDLSSEEAHALASEVNRKLKLPGASFDAESDGRTPGRSRHPCRRGFALVGSHEHGPGLPEGGFAGRGPRNVRVRGRSLRTPRRHRRGPTGRRTSRTRSSKARPRSSTPRTSTANAGAKASSPGT